MTYNYYNPKDESASEFCFGDVNLELLEKKEKIPGMFMRTLRASKDGGPPMVLKHL